MIGMSKAMRDLYRTIEKSCEVDAPMVIDGESGTGKELAARAIHQLSSRSSGPFVAVNCAALPATLIQSELFGHEKGAFTGAQQRKIGRLEAAAGGTIFLDEIGDLPLDLQVNLLRVLQNRTIERLGSNQEIHLNVRIIAASHVNLEQAVEQGRFREDLYYRLNVLRLHTPPLREREGDVTLLAQHYFNKLLGTAHRTARGFSQQAIRVMTHYTWPGNVRELVNRVGRAAIMSENRLLTPGGSGAGETGDERRHPDPGSSPGASRGAGDTRRVAAQSEQHVGGRPAAGHFTRHPVPGAGTFRTGDLRGPDGSRGVNAYAPAFSHAHARPHACWRVAGQRPKP